MSVEHEIIRAQARDMSDERLARELAFAQADNTDPHRDVRVAAILEEQKKREQ